MRILLDSLVVQTPNYMFKHGTNVMVHWRTHIRAPCCSDETKELMLLHQFLDIPGLMGTEPIHNTQMAPIK
jgi:hypothetical protein